MSKNHSKKTKKKKKNSRASRKEQNLKLQNSNFEVRVENGGKNRKPSKKVKAALPKSDETDLPKTSKADLSKASETDLLKSSESDLPKAKETALTKTGHSALDGNEAIPTFTGVTSKRLVGATASCMAFALIYSILIVPYMNIPSNAITEATTVKAVTEVKTTTALSTDAETTSESTSETTAVRKPAAPVTKVYKPKTTAAPKVTAASKSVRLNVPMVSQLPSYPTGCEAASATMLLQYYGYNVGIGTLVSAIPRENLYAETLPDGSTRVYGPSIYQKFVGDPRQTYTSETPGYGAFAPVVTSAINSVISRNGGKHIAKNITGSSVNTLLNYLDKGYPIIVWSTARMKTPEFVNSWYIKTDSGDKYFEYPRGTHVTVLTGYDSSKVYMNDPYFGKVSFSHSDFSSKYALLGKQAILIEKYETTTAEESTAIPESTTDDETTASEESTTSLEGATEEETTVSEESTTLADNKTFDPESAKTQD